MKSPKTLILLIVGFLLPSHAFAAQPDQYILYGDSRTNLATHEKVIKSFMAFHPKAIFHTGDLVWDGQDPQEWATFSTRFLPLYAKGHADFYPALGNHERHGKTFFSLFNLPLNKGWYAVHQGPLLFLILDSTSAMHVGSEQYLWLKTQLDTLPSSNRFVFPIFHHPLFSKGSHAQDDMNLRPILLPLFEKAHISAAFSGHDHNYQRFWYNNMTFITTGGGGAPLYGQTRNANDSQKFVKAHHFCVMTVATDNSQVTVTAYTPELEILDSFTIKHR